MDIYGKLLKRSLNKTPFIVFYISKDLKREKKLTSKEDEEILKVAEKTWNYFEENLAYSEFL